MTKHKIVWISVTCIVLLYIVLCLSISTIWKNTKDSLGPLATFLAVVVSIANAEIANKIQQENISESKRKEYNEILPFFRIKEIDKAELSPISSIKLTSFYGKLFEIRNISDQPALLFQVISNEITSDDNKYNLQNDNSLKFGVDRLERYKVVSEVCEDRLIFSVTEEAIKDDQNKRGDYYFVRVGVYFLNTSAERIKISYELKFTSKGEFVDCQFVNTNWQEFSKQLEYKNKSIKYSYNYSDFHKKNVSKLEQNERKRYVTENYDFENMKIPKKNDLTYID